MALQCPLLSRHIDISVCSEGFKYYMHVCFGIADLTVNFAFPMTSGGQVTEGGSLSVPVEVTSQNSIEAPSVEVVVEVMAAGGKAGAS